MWRVLAFLALSAGAFGQPFVYYRGVVNAGSFLPPGLPNGAIARGSMFSVFGRNLGPASAQQVSAFPLQPTFAGVAVELSQGTNKVSALPVYVSAAQLNVILPSTTPLGAVSLRVVYNGQTGNPIPINVTAASIGLFSVNGGGFGPGIVQNFVSQASQPINSLSATARPGQTEILWGTGLGAATFSDAVAPTAVTLDTSLELFVGGVKAAVSYAGRTPCCASIDQIVFAVPANAPSGCYVPVVARSCNGLVSNTVTMAIDSSGAPCRDAHNPLSSQFRGGGKTAITHLARETIRVDVRANPPYDVVSDTLLATFRDEAASDFFFSAFTALPPLGSCTNYGGSTTRVFSLGSPFARPGGQIDVGAALTVESPARRVEAQAIGGGLEGTFAELLGGVSPVRAIPVSVLSAGPFTIAALGKGSIAPFRFVLEPVNTLSWTNRDQIVTVGRARDLTVTWSGTPGVSRGVAILGFAERTSYNAVGGFICLAQPNTTGFTIPSYVLSALPASDLAESSNSARISVGNIPLGTTASLAGFDYAVLGVSAWSGKTVIIQ